MSRSTCSVCMYPASNKDLNKETDEVVYFFTPSFHPLDNFSAHAIKIWGNTFPTAEHAFHWKKFIDIYPKIAERILAAKSPQLAQEIAHSHKTKVSAKWYELRVSIMEQIFRAKAKQHRDVHDALKRTRKRIIVENSPVDSFWGTGPEKKGKNMVGKIWMKVRDSLGL